MSKKNSDINVITEDKTNGHLSRFHSKTVSVQNIILVWLDPNIAGILDDEHKDIVNRIRSIVNVIHIFSDPNECSNFLHEIEDGKIFMIVSGALGQFTVPHIHNLEKLDSIYVFCGSKSMHEKWTPKWTKIRGVFNQIGPLCDLLKDAVEKNDENFVSISFVSPTNVNYQNFDQIDQTFMYTQVLKEIIFEIQYNQQSFNDLVDFFKNYYQNYPNELKLIQEFEDNYRKYSPIYWYTHPGFIHSTLNRSLRIHDVEKIIKMGFFIQDLHNEIDKLYREQAQNEEKRSFTVFRGQGLSKDNFEKLSKAKGGLVSFNNFLSTSKKREISLEFCHDALQKSELIAVLFKMVIDPCELATPYAFINDESYFKGEEEILFSMHTIFRIGEMKQIGKNNRLYQVILTLTNSKNKQLHALTELLRQETQGSTGWHRLGMLLIKLAKFDQAEQVYKVLLDLTSNDDDKALLYHQLGLIKRNQDDYTEALSFYKQALEIYQKIRPTEDLDLATTYNNIGYVYNNMGNYTEALSYYEKSRQIYENILSDDHPTLAISYNNIGVIYKNLGNYEESLKFHEKAVEIEEKTLPENHPHLAISYKNLGLVYKNLGDYTNSLLSHEKALDIELKILPTNHPSLSISYNNIGLICDALGDYSKSLSFYEKTLEIYQEILPTNHLNFASSYNNIGTVYKHIGEYSKALSIYKRALEIEKKLLPLNHPSLATSYSNIGIVYDNMGEYSQALSSLKNAIEIYQKTLRIDHPLLAIAYNNIAAVYDNMGDYETALSYYKQTVEIEQKHLSSNHPDLATSYNNIGLVYYHLENYSDALSFYEKSLEIYEKNLSSNHPDLATLYNNIGLTYQKLKQYSEALTYFEKSLKIRQEILPSNHFDLITCYGNLSQLYGILGEYSKGNSFYEKLVQAQGQNPNSTMSYKCIDRIFNNNNDDKSKSNSCSRPIIVVDEDPFDEPVALIKHFRRRLEAIRRKIESK